MVTVNHYRMYGWFIEAVDCITHRFMVKPERPNEPCPTCVLQAFGRWLENAFPVDDRPDRV